jgi:hypothetical protein
MNVLSYGMSGKGISDDEGRCAVVNEKEQTNSFSWEGIKLSNK